MLVLLGNTRACVQYLCGQLSTREYHGTICIARMGFLWPEAKTLGTHSLAIGTLYCDALPLRRVSKVCLQILVHVGAAAAMAPHACTRDTLCTNIHRQLGLRGFINRHGLCARAASSRNLGASE